MHIKTLISILGLVVVCHLPTDIKANDLNTPTLNEVCDLKNLSQECLSAKIQVEENFTFINDNILELGYNEDGHIIALVKMPKTSDSNIQCYWIKICPNCCTSKPAEKIASTVCL